MQTKARARSIEHVFPLPRLSPRGRIFVKLFYKPEVTVDWQKRVKNLPFPASPFKRKNPNKLSTVEVLSSSLSTHPRSVFSDDPHSTAPLQNIQCAESGSKMADEGEWSIIVVTVVNFVFINGDVF